MNPIKKKSQSEPSILIILMGSLGDLIRGLSLVSHIKSTWPHSRVTWLVEPKWRDLTYLHPGIDRVIVFKRSKNVLGVWGLRKKLNQEHFDITLDLQRHFKSGFFSFLSGAKRRIGFNPQDSKELNWIFNNEYIARAGERIPKIRHYMKFTEHLGLDSPIEFDFGFSRLDFHKLLPKPLSNPGTPFIAVVLGSSWDSKDWCNQGYLDLITGILSSGNRRVVLLGDNSQAANAKKLLTQIQNDRLMDLVGKTSLIQLLAVLKTVKAAVGPDSGPGHMAAAVNTPYVTLFGPTSPQRAAPYNCEHLVVQPDLECLSCYKKKCPELDARCMKMISPEAVREKLDQALKTKIN